MIWHIFWAAIAVIIATVGLIAAAYAITDDKGGHTAAEHHWLGRLPAARHALRAAVLYVPGPAPADAHPPASSEPPGPGTLHRPAIHHHAALAWQAAGVNATQKNWTPHGIEDTTSWDTRLSAELRAILDGAETTGAYVDKLFRKAIAS